MRTRKLAHGLPSGGSEQNPFFLYVEPPSKNLQGRNRAQSLSESYMEILQTVLVVVFFISCVVLMFFILIQSGKGGSLGIMGGGGSSSPFGSSTVDIVEKATWYGIAAFLTLAIISAVAFADSGPKINLPKSEPQAEAPANSATPSPATPGQPAAPAQPGTPAQATPTTPAAPTQSAPAGH